jgi:NTE family protein
MSLRKWLDQGPFTLSLTSGFFGFYSHLGFMKAFIEEGYSPQKFRGCSAGAIVSAAFASGHSTHNFEELLTSITRNDFWDPKIGPGLLRGEKFFSLLQKQVKAHFDHLEIPLEVSVFDIKAAKTTSIKGGSLPEAIWASCAVPVMFHPVKIEGRHYWDGGLFDPLGIVGIDPKERVLIHDISNKTLLGIPPKTSHLQNAKIIRLKNIPSCGPHKMHAGSEIIETVYRQAKALFRL